MDKLLGHGTLSAHNGKMGGSSSQFKTRKVA